MKSDTELFGDLKGKKFKFGATGVDNFEDDPNAIDAPEVMDAPGVSDAAKQTPSYNGNDSQNETKPIGAPQTLAAVPSDIAPPVPTTSTTPIDTPPTISIAPSDITPTPTAGNDVIGPTTFNPTTPAANYSTGGYNAPASITARTGAAPSGWDQTKWDDPTHQSPKYAVAGIVQQAIDRGEKNLTPDVVAAIAKAYPGATQINGTSMNIPGIGTVQVMNDGQARWDNINGNDAPMSPGVSAQPSAPLEDVLAGQGTQASAAPISVASEPAAAAPLADVLAGQGAAPGLSAVPSGVGSSVNDELANILAGGVDSDPALAAYKRSITRSTDQQRAQLAEEAAQGGTASSGGTDGRIRQLEEGRDESIAGFAGDRAAQVQQLKVQADQDLRQLGFNYASLNQQQKQFADTLTQNKSQFTQSLGFNYAQLSQQQKQFLANLSQNRDQFLQSLGLSYEQLSSQQRLALQQLQQQGDQFNKTLGFNYDTLEANQNNIAANAVK